MKKRGVWLFGAGFLAQKFMADEKQQSRVKEVKGLIDNDLKKCMGGVWNR